jgi:hypothetical protein
MLRRSGPVAAAWGVAGVSLLLLLAIVRLAPFALQLGTLPLGWPHQAALLLWIAGMAYFEGYRGFQLAFSPRVAARARHLALHPTPVRALLAPFFCMAYFGAPRARRITSWVITATVTLLVVTMRHVPQPWRGIVDAGVVVGLTWGLVTVWLSTVRVFNGQVSAPAEVTP